MLLYFQRKQNQALKANAQINAANRGYHTMNKYKNIDCVIINETELHYESRDKNSKISYLMSNLSSNLNISDLIVTQGSEGATLYNKKLKKYFYMDAFATKVVDKIGSGDTMLSLISIFLRLGLDKTYALLIGSLGASQWCQVWVIRI